MNQPYTPFLTFLYLLGILATILVDPPHFWRTIAIFLALIAATPLLEDYITSLLHRPRKP